MAILRSTTIIGSLTLSGPLSANEQAKATNSNFGLIKLGYTANGQNVPLKLSDDGLAYVTVPTTDLSGYLPLTGGTISGNLTVNGTSTFNVSAGNEVILNQTGAVGWDALKIESTTDDEVGISFYNKAANKRIAFGIPTNSQLPGYKLALYDGNNSYGYGNKWLALATEAWANDVFASKDKSIGSPKALLTGNLNDYRGANNYGVYYGGDGATNSVLNAPNNFVGAFSLIVTGLDDSRTMQTFISGYTRMSGLGTITRIFIREHINYGGGSTEWTPWRELINSAGGTIDGVLNFSAGGRNINNICQDGDGKSGLMINSKNAEDQREITVSVPGVTNTWSHVQFGTSSFPYGSTRKIASEEWSTNKFSPIGHTHNSSQITDLTSLLNQKANATHTHAISDVANLQTNLDGKLNTSSLGESTFKVTRGTSVPTNTTGYWAAMCNSDNNGAILPTEKAWWHVLSMDWTGSDNTHWVSQLALPTENGDSVYYRKNVSGQSIDNSSWVKLANSSDLDNYLPIQNPTFSGILKGPKWTNEPGTDEDCHSIVLGTSNVNYCNFYEYGGVWNFYKHVSDSDETLVAKIQEDGIYHNNTRLSKEGHTHTSFGDLTVNNLIVSTNLTANMASINNGFSCNGGFNQYANAYFHNNVSFDKSDSVYISGNVNNGALFTRGILGNINMNPSDTETQYSSIWGLISPGVTTYDQITILRMRRKISGGDNVETSISFGCTFRNAPLVIVQEGGLSNATWTQYKGNTVVKSVSTTGAVIVSGKAERPPMTFLIIGQRLSSW